jgi:hypothetical protein
MEGGQAVRRAWQAHRFVESSTTGCAPAGATDHERPQAGATGPAKTKAAAAPKESVTRLDTRSVVKATR